MRCSRQCFVFYCLDLLSYNVIRTDWMKGLSFVISPLYPCPLPCKIAVCSTLCLHSVPSPTLGLALWLAVDNGVLAITMLADIEKVRLICCLFSGFPEIAMRKCPGCPSGPRQHHPRWARWDWTKCSVGPNQLTGNTCAQAWVMYAS